jgi:hypothetical protein
MPAGALREMRKTEANPDQRRGERRQASHQLLCTRVIQKNRIETKLNR